MLRTLELGLGGGGACGGAGLAAAAGSSSAAHRVSVAPPPLLARGLIAAPPEPAAAGPAQPHPRTRPTAAACHTGGLNSVDPAKTLRKDAIAKYLTVGGITDSSH